MATYDSMRVSIVGGGVANANAKAPRDNSAHIFIGLGGTGMAALKTMKQMIYERLESDDPAAEVPKYDRIAFLGVDSDKTQLTPRKAYYDLDPQSEFCNIGVSNIATVLAAPRLLEQRSDLQWFNFRRISVDNATAGAGGVRQMGRYLLSESTGKPSNNFFTKVKETIRNAVTTSNVRPPVDRVYVHLFTGIGGGTGSGTFIDACYLIRKAFADLTITDRSKLYGYFYLPDVNLDADGIRNNPLIEAYIKDNGFAALMEFDYLMSAESIGEEFQHKYAGVEIVGNSGQAIAPVHMCHLLSVTDMGGNRRENGLRFATNATAEYILNYMTMPNLTEENRTDNVMTLEGNINNLFTARESMDKKRGANYVYTVLGSASAIIPYKQFSTYLASYLFRYFEPLCSNEPLPKDVDDIVKGLRLALKDMAVELRKGSQALSINADAYNTAALRGAIDASNAQTVLKTLGDFMGTWEANRRGTETKNLHNLRASVTDFSTTAENPVAYLAKIFKYLQEHFMNAGYGPNFICELIDSNRVKTLKNHIKGLKTANDDMKQKAMGQSAFRESELLDAAIAFKTHSPKLALLSKLKARYLHEWELYYENEDRIYTCDLLATLLTDIESGLEQLLESYYAIFRECWDTLCATFSSNRKAFDENNIPAPANVIELVSWRDEKIKEKLDEGIAQKLENTPGVGLTANREIDQLLRRLMGNFALWSNGREAAIVNQIADYINDRFSRILNKSMEELLVEKYGTSNTDQLSDQIKRGFIDNVLLPNSVPVFHINGLFSAETPNLATVSVFSVPHNVDAIKHAASSYKVDGGDHGQVEVREAFLKDRMSVFKFHSGIPLFAYFPLCEYHDFYSRKLERAGKHYYEGCGDGKDWRNLPMPFPRSFEFPEFHWTTNELKRMDHLKKVFDRALAIGCIDLSGADKFVIETPEYVQQYSTTTQDAEAAQQVMEQWNTYKQILFTGDLVTRHAFKTEGNPMIALDNFIRFLRLNEIAQREVEKFDTVEQQMAELRSIADDATVAAAVQQSFYNSLFTGWARIVPGRIELLDPYAPDAAENVTRLTDAAEDYSTALLYQAFLSYKKLPDVTQKAINNQIAQTLNNMTSEISAKVKQEETRYRALVQAGKAATAKLANRQEVLAFYADFEQALGTFLANYI